MVRYSRKELNEKCSNKQDAEIERLLAKGTIPDDQLDLSDIPEVTDWSNAVHHNQFYRPVKQQTSIRLDADVLAWFKAQGKGYQTRMNEILRQAMINEIKKL
jgi:uncharacterized protein (DUF4415 family)